MKDEEGLPLKAFYALCNSYAELKDRGEITQEQFDQVMGILDQIEELSETELEDKLQNIFPDYTPKNIPEPGEQDSRLEKFFPEGE